MSIKKKSLMSTLKTAKKASRASDDVNAKPTSVNSKRMLKRAAVASRRASHASKISLNYTKIQY